MPYEQTTPGNTADWLRHAKSDFTLASQPPVPGILLEMLCFHAQQAVEKSLKAVLVHNNVRFPYAHSIANLITIIQEAGID